jgi:hypothetical protein
MKKHVLLLLTLIFCAKVSLKAQIDKQEMLASTQLYGKEIKYMLGIPKGDTHDWKDKKVSWTDAYGETHVCRTYGFPITGIEENIPTKWHKKVRCTDYE